MKRRILKVTGVLVALFAWPASMAFAQTPELPRVYVDTTYPTQTGTIRNVAAGQSLQAAIEAAVPGDTIVLQAGATFTEEVILKWKSNPSNKWIVIRSSSTAFDQGGALQPGTRVNGASTQDASQMAKIRGIGNNVTVIKTEWNPSNPRAVTHYRLVGLDVAPPDGENEHVNVIELGGASAASTSAADIVIDRCFVHGLDDPLAKFRRGISLQGTRMAVIDSYVSNFHTPAQPEAQAIAGWNGAGPYKIVNNFLEAAGENILFGGGDPAVNLQMPSDIEIRRNFFTKRDAWRNQAAYSVKNLFELKTGVRVLLEGNVLENSWPDEQFYAIVITPKSQDGNCSWCAVQDVTIRHNIVRHGAGGINIQGVANAGPAQRILFFNNLFDDMNPAKYGQSGVTKFLQILGGPEDVIFEHNTVLNYTSNAVYFANSPPDAYGFVFRDNLVRRGSYGVNGGGSSEGVALAEYAPDAVFVENAIAGVPTSLQASYPPGNLFPTYAQFEEAFTNYNGGDGGDYTLDAVNYYSSTNPDIGADISAINAAIGGSTPPSETVLLEDNFNDNLLSASWVENDLWSGFTDPAVPVNESNQRLEIGPIPNQSDTSTYNGIRSGSYNFTNGYAQVRIAQAASSQAYTMFAVGINSSNYYRIFVFGTTLVCQQRIAGNKEDLLTTTYNPANHRFVRIEHTGGKVVFLAAPDNLGQPGAWVPLHNSRDWATAAVPLTSLMFELKAGISGPDASAGSAYFDDFRAARR